MNSDIRLAGPEDLDLIVMLEEQSPAKSWSADSIKELLCYDGNGGDFIKLAYVIPEVGYVGVSRAMDEAEILDLIIDRDRRRQGAGRALMEHLQREMAALGVTKFFLEVEDDNDPAIALYRSLQYEDYNRRPDYYGPGRGAILMRRILG